MDTKACSLTDDEIEYLIIMHGSQMHSQTRESSIERINYLNKRLKAEKKEKTETQTANVEATAKGDGW